MSRKVIFDNKRYESISALARAIGYPIKKVWNHLVHGSEIGDTGHCVDYAFESEDRMEIAERTNKLK